MNTRPNRGLFPVEIASPYTQRCTTYEVPVSSGRVSWPIFSTLRPHPKDEKNCDGLGWSVVDGLFTVCAPIIQRAQGTSTNRVHNIPKKDSTKRDWHGTQHDSS